MYKARVKAFFRIGKAAVQADIAVIGNIIFKYFVFAVHCVDMLQHCLFVAVINNGSGYAHLNHGVNAVVGNNHRRQHLPAYFHVRTVNNGVQVIFYFFLCKQVILFSVRKASNFAALVIYKSLPKIIITNMIHYIL